MKFLCELYSFLSHVYRVYQKSQKIDIYIDIVVAPR